MSDVLEAMSRALAVERGELEHISNIADSLHRRLRLNTRKGERTVFHPAKRLKALQRWLVANVLSFWPVHPCAMAYRKDVSIRHNALQHNSSRFLCRLDFRNFFGSISSNDIIRHMEQLYQTDPKRHIYLAPGPNRDFICRLVTFRGSLTIGAVSSPTISNAICYELDARISKYARAENLNYTRYADDIFLSTSTPHVLKNAQYFVQNTLPTLGIPSNLQLNASKTRHYSTRSRRVITGVVITPTGDLSTGRTRKRLIRTLIYKFDTLPDAEKRRVQGMLGYMQYIEPNLINSLSMKFGQTRVEAVMRWKTGAPSCEDQEKVTRKAQRLVRSRFQRRMEREFPF